MTPEELTRAVSAALDEALQAQELTLSEGADRPEVRIERPKSREHGDWATNIALQLGKRVGRNPREVAQILATRLVAIDGVAAVDIAGPGFLNIRLDAAAAGALAATTVSYTHLTLPTKRIV